MANYESKKPTRDKTCSKCQGRGHTKAQCPNESAFAKEVWMGITSTLSSKTMVVMVLMARKYCVYIMAMANWINALIMPRGLAPSLEQVVSLLVFIIYLDKK